MNEERKVWLDNQFVFPIQSNGAWYNETQALLEKVAAYTQYSELTVKYIRDLQRHLDDDVYLSPGDLEYIYRTLWETDIGESKTPANHNTKWSQEDTRKCFDLFVNGIRLKKIGTILGRTTTSVRDRLCIMRFLDKKNDSSSYCYYAFTERNLKLAKHQLEMFGISKPPCISCEDPDFVIHSCIREEVERLYRGPSLQQHIQSHCMTAEEHFQSVDPQLVFAHPKGNTMKAFESIDFIFGLKASEMTFEQYMSAIDRQTSIIGKLKATKLDGSSKAIKKALKSEEAMLVQIVEAFDFAHGE